jgi:hypothetical protein
MHGELSKPNQTESKRQRQPDHEKPLEREFGLSLLWLK